MPRARGLAPAIDRPLALTAGPQLHHKDIGMPGLLGIGAHTSDGKATETDVRTFYANVRWSRQRGAANIGRPAAKDPCRLQTIMPDRAWRDSDGEPVRSGLLKMGRPATTDPSLHRLFRIVL